MGLEDLDNYFADHVASSLEKQEHLATLIADHAWQFDMPTGTLTFTRDTDVKETAVQLLGTQSFVSGTWLWAWGNEVSEIPADLLGAADHLREVGERDGIKSFSTPELTIIEDDARRLAMIACGMLQMQGYYRGPFGDGAAYFLIQECEWAVEKVERPAGRIALVFPEAISRFEIHNLARAFRGHLRYHGAEIIEDRRDRIVGRFENGDEVRAEFDAAGKLVSIHAEMKPGFDP